MTDLATLSFAVDAPGADATIKRLDAVTAAAGRADAAVKGLGSAQTASAAGALGLTTGLSREAAAAIESVKAMRALTDQFAVLNRVLAANASGLGTQATAAEKAARAHATLERQVNSLIGRLDPLTGATIKTAAANDMLNRAVTAGLVSRERANELISIATKKHAELAAAQAAGTSGMAGLTAAVNGIRGSVTGFVGALGPVGAAIAAGFTVGKIKDFAIGIAESGSQMQSFTARVAMFTGPGAAAAAMMDKLFETAQRTGSAFESTVAVFTRVSFAARDMGASNAEVARFAETVQKLGRIGGGGLQETNAAMVQLGQALASGRLGGDELRSILEGMPALARAIADGLGVSVGNLRAMGAAGQLTADKVFGAIIAASAKADAEFKKLPITLEQAGQTAANAWDKFAAAIDKSFGLSDKLATALQSIAGILGSVGRTAEQEYAVQIAQIDKLIAKRKELIASMSDGSAMSFINQFNNKDALARTTAEIEVRNQAAAALAKQIEKESLLTEQRQLGEKAAGIAQAANKKMQDGLSGLLTALGLASEGGKIMTKEQVALVKATEAVEEAIKRGGDALKDFGGSAETARAFLKALSEQADPIAKQIKSISDAAEAAGASGGADKFRVQQDQAFRNDPKNTGKDPAAIAAEVEKYIAATKRASEANEAASATFARMTAAAGDNGAAVAAVAVKQRLYTEIKEHGSQAAADLFLATGKLPAGFEAVAKSIGTQVWASFNAEVTKAIRGLKLAADEQEALARAAGNGSVAIADAERVNKAYAFALKAGGAETVAFKNAYAAAMAEFRRGDIAKAAADLKNWSAEQDRAIAAAKNLTAAEKEGGDAIRKAGIENAIAAEVAKSKVALGEKEIAVIREKITALSDEQKQQSINNAIRSKQEELEIATAEYRLVGATVEERARELSAIKAVIEAKRLGLEIGDEEYQQYVKLVATVEEMKVKTADAEKQRDAWLEPFKNAAKGIQDAFASAFESIFSGGVKSFADLGKTVLQIMIKMAAQIAALMVFRPMVGNVMSAAGASPSFISNLIPGFGNSNSQSGGGFGIGDVFSGIKNLFSGPSDFLANTFPSLFGAGLTGGAGIAAGLLGPGGMALGGGATSSLAIGTAAGPLAGMAPLLGMAAIALPIIMSFMSKKPTVGPNSNATIGWRDGGLSMVDSGADNGGDRGAAETMAKDFIKTLKATMDSVGGTLKDGIGGLQFGIFKGRAFVDDTRMGGTATYEKNQFDNVGDAIADGLKRMLSKGVDGLSEEIMLVLKNTTAKTIEELNEDLTFGKNFRDQIDLMNAGVGTLTAQVTGFRIAAKVSAQAEVQTVKDFLENAKNLFADSGTVTTRTVRQALEYGGTSGGENNEQATYTDGASTYQMVGTTLDGRVRMVNIATNEFIEVIQNATTGLYEFDKAVTETSPGGNNTRLEEARAAIRTRALSAIGLGVDPDSDRAATGDAAAYLQRVEEIKAWQKVLEAAGLTVEESTAKIAEAVAKAKGEAGMDFNDSIGARLAAIRDDSATTLAYVLKDIEKAREQELTNAAVVGGDIVAVEAYYAELRVKAIEAAAQAAEAVAMAAYQKTATNSNNLAAAMRLEGDEVGAMLLEIATNAETRRREARAAGLDMVVMERLLAGERKKAMEELGKSMAAKELSRVTGNAGLDSTLIRLGGNERDADLMDFDIQTAQRRQAARDAGLDMVKFEDVVARERLAIITRYANDATRVTNQTAIDTYNVQIDAQSKLYDSAVRTVDVMTKLADSLDKTRVNLRTGASSPFSGEQVLAELAANYNTIKGKALNGSGAEQEKALGEIGEAAAKYAEFAKSYYGGNAEYAAIFAGIDDTILKASQAATSQASIATQQRDLAKTQVDLLTQARDALVAINNGIGTGSNGGGSGAPVGPPSTLIGGASFDTVARDAGSWDGSAQSWSGLVSRRQAAVAEMTDTSELVRILYQYYGGRRTAGADGDTGAVEIVSRLRALNVPGYAMGGMHMGGLRMVGERGPELEATGPARYWSAEQTKNMVGSNDNSDVCARLERIEGAIRGQTNVVARAGDMNNEGHARTAGNLEEINRKTALAEAA